MEMFFVIMIIICIIGFGVSSEYQKKQKQQVKEYILGSKYIDGTLKIFDNNVNMDLTIEPDYIALTSEPYNLKISYDKLLDYNIKTTEEISEHLTLTRVLVLGIFALGAKKKEKTVEKFIVLDFLDNDNKKQTAILQTPFPELSTAGMKRLHEFKVQYDNKIKMNINKKVKVDA